MKSTLSLLALTVAALPLAAQTTPAPVHHAAAHPVAKAACAKLPELSPRIPALPASAPCAKALYTITSIPSSKLEYVSPLENPGLKETLGLEPSSFSLAYIDTKIGTGPLAAPHKWYTIHYTGYLADGTKFDSSVDRNDPINIEYGKHTVIPGWDTGFDGMHVGGKRRLFIPYQLAYGPNGRQPTIPPRAELIFDVELLAQDDFEPKPKAPPVPPPAPASAPAPPPAPAPAPQTAVPPPPAKPN